MQLRGRTILLILVLMAGYGVAEDYKYDNSLYLEGRENEFIVLDLGCVGNTCFDNASCSVDIIPREDQNTGTYSRILTYIRGLLGGGTQIPDVPIQHLERGKYYWEKPKDLPAGQYLFSYGCTQTIGSDSYDWYDDFIFTVSTQEDSEQAFQETVRGEVDDDGITDKVAGFVNTALTMVGLFWSIITFSFGTLKFILFNFPLIFLGVLSFIAVISYKDDPYQSFSTFIHYNAVVWVGFFKLVVVLGTFTVKMSIELLQGVRKTFFI